MFGLTFGGYRGDTAGFAWPDGSAVGTIEGAFGPRTYASHIATIGYDYDFHPGADVYTSVGTTLKAPINGAIQRLHFTHFGFEDSTQLGQFTLTTPSSSLAAALGTNVLNLTCSRVGAVTFPTTVDTYGVPAAAATPKIADWTLEMRLNATISTVGTVGIALMNGTGATATEWVAIEYDGATITIRAKTNGANWTANGTTSAQSNMLWLRIAYTQSTDTYAFQYATGANGDANTFTSITTEATKTWLATTPTLIPTIYWKSGDTNATPYTIAVAKFNFADENNSVGRFGNWLQISGNTYKCVLVHFQSLSATLGQFVTVGAALGTAGATGFDTTSGRISNEHCHFEYHPNNNYSYARSEGQNPLKAGLLPRADVSNNVSVVRTSTAGTNDPDGVDSHKLSITVTRADQDFDLNSVTLTGNTTSRTINFDTRSGLNANVDIPKQSGVYIVPSAFDQNSATKVVDVYFAKATVGSTFVSYSVLDCAGNTVASG